MLRTMDATDFNRIARHPEVLPWLGYGPTVQEPDFTHVLADPMNIGFLTGTRDGGYILRKRQPGLYEAHTLALPSARGRPMLRLMREGFAKMFTATDCIEVVSMVPAGNDAAEAWSKLAGFRNTFKRNGVFNLMGELVDMQYKSLTYQDWVLQDRTCKLLGEIFHTRLATSGVLDNHPDDPVHDSWVGATIAGCIEGNSPKAVGLYNRWAAVAGYEPVHLLSVNPPLVDVGTAVIQLLSGAIDVLQVRQPGQSGTLGRAV